MEKDALLAQYLEKNYTREWEKKRLCMVCDKVLSEDILEHFKKYHKNIYNDLMNEINRIEDIMKNS
ncbi:MAG: hypothetical protein ACP5R0_03650 [Thermoplasmata archaeon]